MAWLLVLAAAAHAGDGCATPLSVSEGVTDLQPAVVALTDGSGSGSGFFLTDDGLLLTAAHVVHGDTTTVHIGDVTIDGAVVHRSDELDLALVQVQGLTTPCLDLADPPPVGGEVWGLGFPGGQELGHSVSKGVTSGIKTVRGATLLQTDANISPGHSGGPLVDAEGRAVGVISWKIVQQGFEGISFAVPRSVIEPWRAEADAQQPMVVGLVARRAPEEQLSLVSDPLGVTGPDGPLDVLDFATLIGQQDVVAEVQRRRRKKAVGWAWTGAGLAALLPTAAGLGTMASNPTWSEAFPRGAAMASIGSLTSAIFLGIGAGQHRKGRADYAQFYSDKGMSVLIDQYNAGPTP